MYYKQTHIQKSILPRHMWRWAGMQELHVLLPYMISNHLYPMAVLKEHIYWKYPANSFQLLRYHNKIV